MLSRDEKRKKIIELRKKGKTIRQIAKVVQMSFGDIGRVIKEELGEQEIEPSVEQVKYNRALQLFEQGKGIFDVAVELHLSYDEVLKIYKDYLKLRNHDKLYKIYQNLGDNIEPFLILHDKMQEGGKTPEDALIISNHIDQLDSLQYSCNLKSRKVAQLNLDIQTLSQNIYGLRNQQNALQYDNGILKGQNYNLGLANQYLANESSRLQSSIQYLKSLGPATINEIAGSEIRSILGRNKEILSMATAAVFLALAQEPQKMYRINALSMMEFNNPFVRADLEFYRSEFLDLAQKAYENLTLQCSQKIVDLILQGKPKFELKTTV